MSWHIDDTTLARYVAGGTTAAVAASAEAHLTACPDCRARLTSRVDTRRLDAIWRGVELRVQTASMPWFERALVRAGVGEDSARLLAATPSLRMSWLAALVGAVLFSALAADASPAGLLVYLTLAPMLPVAGVAAAYGRFADPAYELAVAAPYSMLRLLLLRSVAVVGCTVALTSLGSLALLGHGWTAVAWLLPALALTLTTLALSARVAPVWAAAGVLTGWVALVLAARQGSDTDLSAFGAPGQVIALAVVALAAAALVHERPSFAYDSRRSA